MTSRVPAEDWPSAYSIVPANAAWLAMLGSRLEAAEVSIRGTDDDPRRWAVGVSAMAPTDLTPLFAWVGFQVHGG